MFFKGVIAVVLMVLFVGCCATPTVVEGVEWKMATLNGESVKGAEADSYTLIFGEENKLSAKGECNRIMGEYNFADDNSVKIESLAATMMFCPNLEQEDKFIKTLESVTKYEAANGELKLYNKDNQLVITFKTEQQK